MSVSRGDGIGVEIAPGIVRGLRLQHDAPNRLSRATELPLPLDDDRQALETLTVLFTELGRPQEPTRVAMFPRGSTLQRIDVTGKSGPELATLRAALLRRRGFDSSVVFDQGPRRWLIVIGWNTALVRRAEQLVERAGFSDVSVEPSPLAIARVVPSTTTVARRVASRDDGFVAVLDDSAPVAASTVEFPARQHPDVDIGTPRLPSAWFDDLVDAEVLDDVIARSAAAVDVATEVPGRTLASVGGTPYPSHPAHDERSIERQVVAVGAAAAAAGLAAASRPVDVISTADPDDRYDRPWVWERLSDIPEVELGTGPTAVQRAGARFLPRLRREHK